MREKAKRYLGIAQQGGYVVLGIDALAVYRKKLFAILIDSKTTDRNRKTMQAVAEHYQIPLCETDSLSDLLGKTNIAAIGIRNKALAELILEHLKAQKKD